MMMVIKYLLNLIERKLIVVAAWTLHIYYLASSCNTVRQVILLLFYRLGNEARRI